MPVAASCHHGAISFAWAAQTRSPLLQVHVEGGQAIARAMKSNHSLVSLNLYALTCNLKSVKV